MVLALFCAASVSRPVVRSISITALALATTIMLGTIAMSIYECRMLEATLIEVGGTAYIVGNWGMHYYPFVRILLSGTVSYATANPVRQHLAAIATIVVSARNVVFWFSWNFKSNITPKNAKMHFCTNAHLQMCVFLCLLCGAGVLHPSFSVCGVRLHPLSPSLGDCHLP